MTSSICALVNRTDQTAGCSAFKVLVQARHGFDLDARGSVEKALLILSL